MTVLVSSHKDGLRTVVALGHGFMLLCNDWLPMNPGEDTNRWHILRKPWAVDYDNSTTQFTLEHSAVMLAEEMAADVAKNQLNSV